LDPNLAIRHGSAATSYRQGRTFEEGNGPGKELRVRRRLGIFVWMATSESCRSQTSALSATVELRLLSGVSSLAASKWSAVASVPCDSRPDLCWTGPVAESRHVMYLGCAPTMMRLSSAVRRPSVR